jgi:hypothetical protein
MSTKTSQKMFYIEIGGLPQSRTLTRFPMNNGWRKRVTERQAFLLHPTPPSKTFYRLDPYPSPHPMRRW